MLLIMCWTPSCTQGSIPQVAHTHAYLDGNYAVQNDCQLMFGESTASATFPAVGRGQPNGTALFNVNELTRIAAERVCSAREAVRLMGRLAEGHGFYGADGGAGEVLMVGDPEEVFVFHILSDPSGRGAIWAAQRVPDDHVAVVANMFSIREIDREDPHAFIYSASVHDVALAYGLWDGRGKLDFTGTYSAGEAPILRAMRGSIAPARQLARPPTRPPADSGLGPHPRCCMPLMCAHPHPLRR